MKFDLPGLRWFKSSASSTNGCVEVAHLLDGGVAVRDTKDRGKAPDPHPSRVAELPDRREEREFDPPGV